MFNTPILFLVFNRLETTKRVFEQIKKIKPSYLFIAADGPRLNVKGEKEKCDEIKIWLTSNINWACDVKTLFRTENKGCKYAVSGGINWFFEHVEEGIILEDDCFPDLSFFLYCEDLLNKYRAHESVKVISGNNFLSNEIHIPDDYYFSKYIHIWGWATWRRAWKVYDVEMTDFKKVEAQKLLKKIFAKREVGEYWVNIFEETHSGKIDTWDYQLVYSIWKTGGVSIIPNTNLVSNIGFGEDATHTFDKDSKVSSLPSYNIRLDKHPEKIKVNRVADSYTSTHVFNIFPQSNFNPFVRLINWIKIIIENKIIKKSIHL